MLTASADLDNAVTGGQRYGMFVVRNLRPTKAFFIRAAVACYVLATLPIVILTAWNPTLRHTFVNTAAHYRSRVASVRAVFIGDSLTAGMGRSINSINLAGSGYTVEQIRQQVPRALSYRPEVIYVMGGTNDLFDSRYDLEFTVASYDAMLSEIQAANVQCIVQCIVTLVPYHATTERRQRIDELNARITQLAHKRGCRVVDLNPLLAPHGTLLPQYTTDGTHFSREAYRVWTELRNNL